MHVDVAFSFIYENLYIHIIDHNFFVRIEYFIEHNINIL